jgi:hypothetical protein
VSQALSHVSGRHAWSDDVQEAAAHAPRDRVVGEELSGKVCESHLRCRGSPEGTGTLARAGITEAF